MPVLLEVNNLSVGYNSPILSNLSFSVLKGDILFIKGKNGCGKSSLIKTICGELRSLSGSVNWNIEKECISVLPQVISYEFPISMSLAELIELFDSREDILDDDILKKRFKDASGGEKQKTIILTRVNTKTKFLILDEPFNHLDKKSSKDIMNFIIQLINQKVIDGVILISHIDVDFSTSRVKELNLS